MYKLLSRRLILFCWCLFASVVAIAQNTLTGVVTDEESNPLPGVTVRLVKAKSKTVTDQRGQFVLKGNWAKGEKVEFSFVGFASRTYKLNGQTRLDVVLKESATDIGEVVVTAKTNINAIDLRGKAGVVENVDMDRVESKPMIDFALSLQGQVPGLVVVNTGELGSRPEIRIRGNSSLRKGNSTNEPLYVLDGQVISSDVFYNLNPTDIKSIKVLKNAAACALYGVKAANGVLDSLSARLSGQAYNILFRQHRCDNPWSPGHKNDGLGRETGAGAADAEPRGARLSLQCRLL